MKKQNTNYTFNVEGSQNQMNVANSEGVQHNNTKESLWKKVVPFFLKIVRVFTCR
jgi:hypothetical protein